MSRACYALLCWLALACGVFAQTASDPNEGFRVSKNGPYEYSPSWWGWAGRSYFLQYSFDLATWAYVPGFIESGQAAATAYALDFSDLFGTAGQSRVFFRLKYTDIPTADPYYADFDVDKVPTWIEMENDTDPLHSADSDFDGMPDDWETWFGLNPHFSGDAAGGITGDLDGDGLSNLAEYQNGAAGSDPTDYYNGLIPTLQILSGDGQTYVPGSFSPAPLVLELRQGITPVNNGPMTVYLADASDGQLSSTNDGNGLATTLHLHTDANGQVRVYYQHPAAIPAVPVQRLIYATVGSTVPTGQAHFGYYYQTSQDDYHYPPNTVGLDASNAIDHRLIGNNPANDKGVFTVQNHTTTPPAYQRNTSCWCYDLRQQMTCISPWNDEGGVTGAGTVITAQHIISSAHNQLTVGSSVRFITANNVVIDSVILGRARHPAYVPAYPDLTVYTLASPLPASITPCKLLPANYASYLSYLDHARPPVLVLDQEEKALVAELRQLDSSAWFVKSALHLDRLGFYEDVIPGDSGDPAFLIINDTLVLLTTLTSGGAGSGTFVTPQISALNAMIVAADADAAAGNPGFPATGLQVQTVDLSGFNTFTSP